MRKKMLSWFSRFFSRVSKNKKESAEKREPDTPKAKRLSLEHFPSETLPVVRDESKQYESSTTTNDKNHAVVVAMASTAAAEAAVEAAVAAAKVVQLTTLPTQSKEVRAAICIQSHYKGYLARRALHALRGLVRLQALVRGRQVRKQAVMTMRCMQTLIRVQDRIREDRLLLQLAKEEEKKHRKEVRETHESLEENKVMMESPPHQHQVGAIKEETTLLASASIYDQWSSEPQKARWGWNWLDRWMAQPWHQGFMASLESSHHAAQNMDVARLSARHSADYPTRKHYTFMDWPEGLARHSADFPNRYRCTFNTPDGHGCTINNNYYERDVPMVPSYMATTQSAKAKVRPHGSVKLQTSSPMCLQNPSARWAASSNNGDALSLPRSPSPRINTTHLSTGLDSTGIVDRTPPRIKRGRRNDFR